MEVVQIIFQGTKEIFDDFTRSAFISAQRSRKSRVHVPVSQT